jgi:hypothetical protein
MGDVQSFFRDAKAGFPDEQVDAVGSAVAVLR